MTYEVRNSVTESLGIVQLNYANGHGTVEVPQEGIYPVSVPESVLSTEINSLTVYVGKTGYTTLSTGTAIEIKPLDEYVEIIEYLT